MQFLAIALGGALGAMCRHGVNLACRAWFGSNFAYGTLAVNVIGCLLIGLLIPLGTAVTPRLGPHAHTALTVGFLGALTTFSTFGFETTTHLEQSQHYLAVANVALNVVLGLLAVFAGLAIGRAVAG